MFNAGLLKASLYLSMDYVTGPPPCPGFKITLDDEVCAKDPFCGTKRMGLFEKNEILFFWSIYGHGCGLYGQTHIFSA